MKANHILCIWVAFLTLLVCSVTARGDEFDDRLASFSKRTQEIKKGLCDCDGPASCVCGIKGEGPCVCPPCAAAKRKEVKALPKAPPIAYKHVCGCPSKSCNCAPLGGCHCDENAMFNRINPRWEKAASGPGYCLWRGNEQLGYLDEKGTYHPLHNGEWCQPTKAPIPLPSLRSEAVQVAQQVCRT